jgi:hypothetical protein
MFYFHTLWIVIILAWAAGLPLCLSCNRVTRLVATITRRFFGVAVAAYFDD